MSNKHLNGEVKKQLKKINYLVEKLDKIKVLLYPTKNNKQSLESKVSNLILIHVISELDSLYELIDNNKNNG
jgi:hypothetical protein